MRHLKTYNLFESNHDLMDLFKKNLMVSNIDITNDGHSNELVKDGVPIGDFRIDYYDNWVTMEMIEVYSNFRRQGAGMIIYQALLDSAIEAGYLGLFSGSFDAVAGTGQQRSPEATGLLNKLIEKNGGKIVEITPDPDDIEDLESDGAPFYGPPYLDFYIDGSGRIKKEKE